jgi:hypothetical protein
MIINTASYGQVIIFENDFDQVSTEEFRNASIVAISAYDIEDIALLKNRWGSCDNDSIKSYIFSLLYPNRLKKTLDIISKVDIIPDMSERFGIMDFD